jgi:hypothetical protein
VYGSCNLPCAKQCIHQHILASLLIAFYCCVQVCFFAHTLEEVRTVEPEDLPSLLEDAAAAAGAGAVRTVL